MATTVLAQAWPAEFLLSEAAGALLRENVTLLVWKSGQDGAAQAAGLVDLAARYIKAR